MGYGWVIRARGTRILLSRAFLEAQSPLKVLHYQCHALDGSRNRGGGQDSKLSDELGMLLILEQ